MIIRYLILTLAVWKSVDGSSIDVEGEFVAFLIQTHAKFDFTLGDIEADRILITIVKILDSNDLLPFATNECSSF